jgi:hypothetical protein
LFDPHSAKIKQFNEHWKTLDYSSRLFGFGNKRDKAELALRIFEKYSFTRP